MKLNLGCGNEKWEGFINVDIDEKLKPDTVYDIRRPDWPFENSAVDQIWMSHTLEHIEKRYWENIFIESNRVLKTSGELYLTFPEFRVCAQYWLDNHKGKKDYWENTIYGRQDSKSDYHVSICDTNEILCKLRDFGFGFFKVDTDGEPQYTALSAQKVRAALTREGVYSAEIFGLS